MAGDGRGTHHRDTVAHDVCPRTAPAPLCSEVFSGCCAWQPTLATRAHHRALCPAVHAQGCTLSNGYQAQQCTLSKSRVAQLVPAPFALPRALLLLVEREAKVCSKEIRAASLIGSPALLAWQYPLPGPEGNRRVTAASKASEPPVQACNFSGRKQSLLGRTP